MCLIVFGWQVHPDYRLVLAANRDEFHERPSAALGWWADHPNVLAGRDLRAGGSWLAAGRAGRFATVTNFRETGKPRGSLRSRGELVSGFVAGSDSAERHANGVDGAAYAGFSLLLADDKTLYYTSNRDRGPLPLSAGIHALGNAALDAPSHKVNRCKAGFQALLDNGEVNETTLFRLLADRTPAPVADVEAGSMPFEMARAMSAPFIVSPEYGTRCTSVLTWTTDDRITLTERRFWRTGEKRGESRFSFTAGGQSA